MNIRTLALCVLSLVSTAVLADGDPAAGESRSAVCAGCHGADGNGVAALPLQPKLAGQSEAYTLAQLMAYRSGERANAVMAGMVAPLSDQDMADIAAYYAGLEPMPGETDPTKRALGEQIYRGGLPDKSVPACIACHGPEGRGNGPAGWPAIGGQWSEYVVQQLDAYAGGARDGGQNQMMRDVASMLNQKEMEAVASYVEGLH